MSQPNRTLMFLFGAALALSGCAKAPLGQADPQRSPPGPQAYSVDIHVPESAGSIATGLTGPQGEPLMVRCATCHSLLDAPLVRELAELDLFHTGLSMDHGELTCGSCHSPDDRDQLHLADGQVVELRDARQLCRQCHGPQHRDYEHGSHGGMQGYWDLSEGPRVRNTCVDCHDAHSPQFPEFLPVSGPNDRLAGGE